MNVVCVMTRNFINSMKLEKGMCQYLGTQTAMAFSAQTNRYQTKSPLLLVKPSLCPWFRLKSWCMSRVRMWASDWSVQDVPGTVPLQGTVWRLGTVTKFQRHFRESGDWNNTACGFFLPWYLGRWRCLMVRISPFTSIGHQKNTWTYPTNIVFYSFYLCFYHEVLEFLLIFENTNSKRVSTPESKTHGTVEFSTTWNSLSNCMGSDSTGWKRTDFLTNNAGGLEIFTRPRKSWFCKLQMYYPLLSQHIGCHLSRCSVAHANSHVDNPFTTLIEYI